MSIVCALPVDDGLAVVDAVVGCVSLPESKLLLPINRPHLLARTVVGLVLTEDTETSAELEPPVPEVLELQSSFSVTELSFVVDMTRTIFPPAKGMNIEQVRDSRST